VFSLFKTKKGDSFLKNIKVDMHSHLIPAIDDGAKNLKDSIELIKNLKEIGYSHLITTPHIMNDSYPNSKETILKGLATLKNELQKQQIDIQIDAAAEYYLDEDFLNKLHNKDILTIKNEFLLFETSYISKPINLEDIIYEIKING